MAKFLEKGMRGSAYTPPPGSGTVFSVPTYAIPDFGWDDAPATPAVPPGDPNNRVPLDRDGQPRPWPGLPGAYTG